LFRYRPYRKYCTQITTEKKDKYLFSSFDSLDASLDFIKSLWRKIMEKVKESSSVDVATPTKSGKFKKKKRNVSEIDSPLAGSDRKRSDSVSSAAGGDGDDDADDASVATNDGDEPADYQRRFSITGVDDKPRSDSIDKSATAAPSSAADSVAQAMSTSQAELATDKAAKQAARVDKFALTQDDWENILKGANLVTLAKDEVIINEGDKLQRIYQVAKASCRIEKGIERKTVLGRMGKEDGVFGEISFLEGGAATASVVADENEATVYIIEGYYLDILFQRNPRLSGRFYHYLAQLLAKRVAQREAALRSGPSANDGLSPRKPNAPPPATPPQSKSSLHIAPTMFPTIPANVPIISAGPSSPTTPAGDPKFPPDNEEQKEPANEPVKEPTKSELAPPAEPEAPRARSPKKRLSSKRSSLTFSTGDMLSGSMQSDESLDSSADSAASAPPSTKKERRRSLRVTTASDVAAPAAQPSPTDAPAEPVLSKKEKRKSQSLTGNAVVDSHTEEDTDSKDKKKRKSASKDA
jgi:hypothetical protein